LSALIVVTIVAIGLTAVVVGPMAVGSSPRSKLKKKTPVTSPKVVNPSIDSSTNASAALLSATAPPALGTMAVLGFNDLGMHCINQDFSEICILPPYNNLHAQVIDRSGEDPRIVTSGVQVLYSVPGNSSSANKTNFWIFAQRLFGLNAPLPANLGLTGHGLTGQMTATADGDWVATGIPLTPITDAGKFDPFQLSIVQAVQAGKVKGWTMPVVPVSWEISCNLCHRPDDPTKTASDILQKHDNRFFYIPNPRYAKALSASKPVLCASCHADPALGTKGVAGVPTMSSAMHTAHASRFTPQVLNIVNGNTCYACHPGISTQCQRDIHLTKGITCSKCHGEMIVVGNPARRPWVDEPHCTDCHKRQGFAFEEPGKLYKDSRGHNGVKCASCHGSPHAITPTVTQSDNVQAVLLQGHPGTINDCKVCHRQTPDDQFNHTLHD